MEPIIPMYQENITVKNQIREKLADMEEYGHIDKHQKFQLEVDSNKVVDKFYLGGRDPRNVALAAISIVSQAADERGFGMYYGKLKVGSVPYFLDLYGKKTETGEGVSTRAINETRNDIIEKTKEKFGGTKALMYDLRKKTKTYK